MDQNNSSDKLKIEKAFDIIGETIMNVHIFKANMHAAFSTYDRRNDPYAASRLNPLDVGQTELLNNNEHVSNFEGLKQAMHEF